MKSSGNRQKKSLLWNLIVAKFWNFNLQLVSSVDSLELCKNGLGTRFILQL